MAIDRMRVRRALVAATTILVPLTLGTPAAAGAGESQVPGEDPISPAAIGVGEPTIYELISDYSWGYRCGVKQPLGAYKSGLSVHQITENLWPSSVLGNPDHLFWVDEVRGVYGVSVKPTGDYLIYAGTPGGMVSFAQDGTIWFALGARTGDVPLGLYFSSKPYDTSAFVRRLFDFDTRGGSTTPCVNVHDPNLMLIWRHGPSTTPTTTVRFRRYQLSEEFPLEIEMDLGHGMTDPKQGTIGIEQLWTRFDPRFQYTFVSWQHKGDDPLNLMGSNPFLYSDDDGDTWRRADGADVKLPILYSDIDDVLVPVDHLAQGVTTRWFVCDLGVSPHGTFWMTLPDDTGSERALDFWFFNGSTWEERTLARNTETCKPHACGVTKNHIVFVYSELPSNHVLKARLSADDGRTWSEPIVLDVLSADDRISWVSFVQPADSYTDESARFFYAYTRSQYGSSGLNYRNNVRWIKFDAPRPGDLNGDGTVGIADLLILLSVWGPCPGLCPPFCLGDIDEDCNVGVADLLALLVNWG